LSNLKFAVNDVSSIYDILTDPNRGGFTPDNCLLMMDKSNEVYLKPIRSNLMSSIRSLSETAKPDDYILFYFSGHGIEENNKSYLLPSDARINVLCDTAVQIDWIKETLKSSKAHATVLILDSCHAGAMKGKAESGRMTKGLHDSLFPATEGFAILASCKLNETSWEMPDKKHGVFSYFLVEGLQGAADYDSDGHIMVSDASRYTADKTTDWSFKEGVQQTPNLEYNVVGDLVLVDVPSLEKKKVSRKVEKARQDLSSFAYPISKIRLNFPPLSKDDETEERASIYAEKMCTYLLKFFDLSEIQYEQNKYKFPLGGFDEYNLEITYKSDSIDRIDQLINASSQAINPSSLIYFASQRFDQKKISSMLKVTKWRVLKYNPRLIAEPDKRVPSIWAEFLLVSARLSKDIPELKLIFISNTKIKESAIVIEQRKEGIALDEKMMQVLMPTKFLRAIGNLWEPK
jgi:hypothetical protein